MSSPVRFGVLGCGRVAATHFDAIDSLGAVAELAAVCDSNPDALDAVHQDSNIAHYASLDEMLAGSDIDVVSICTPSGLHAEHACRVAEAGKHVLVEKPLDVTLEAVERMKTACEQAGVEIFPIFQNRFNPTIQLVKEAIDLGRFGRILAINSTVIWKRNQAYYDRDSWRGTRAMDGGALMNQGIHFIDAIRYLGGEVTQVVPMLGRLARDIECEDTGSVLFKFESGALGNIFVTMTGTTDLEGSITLIGESGTVKIGGTAMNDIDVWEFDTPLSEQDAKADSAQVAIKSVYGNGHQAVYQAVVNHLTGGEPYPLSVEDARKTLALVLRSYGE